MGKNSYMVKSIKVMKWRSTRKSIEVGVGDSCLTS